MLLFSRIETPVASPRQIMPWALRVTQHVKDVTALDVGLWGGDYGYPIGTLIWSLMVESQSEMVAAFARLAEDNTYNDLADEATPMFPTPGQDVLREVIYGSPSEPPAVGAVGLVTTATAVVDRMPDAIGWAIGAAQHAEKIIDQPVAVLSDVYGTMGGITWITVFPDVGAVDAARAKTSSDAGYIASLAATKDLFLPGSGHRSQVSRFA